MHTKSADLIAMTLDTIAVHLQRKLRVLQSTKLDDMHLVLDILRAFDAAVETIENDGRLTAIGRADQTQAAVRPAVVALDMFEQKTIGGLDTRIASVRAQILNAIQPEPPTDPAILAMRDARRAEIWREAADLDSVQLTGIYVDATDEERAALEALPRRIFMPADGGLPRWTNRLDASLIDSMVSAKAAQRSPELAAELQDLDAIRSAYASVVATARQALREVVPSLSVDDPIAAMARPGA
jgi:hypothetical protein